MTASRDPGVGAAPVGAARALCLYLLSLSSLAPALAAWAPAAVGQRLALWAIVFALALVVGEVLGQRMPADRTRRERLRIVAGLAYQSLVALALLAVTLAPSPALITREVWFFTPLQALFLGLSGLGRGALGALQNALVLVILAAVGGGVPATLAALTYAALLGFFLTFDHFSRKLTAYSVGRGPWLRIALVEASGAVAPVWIGLAVFLTVVPPSPAAGIRFDPGDDPSRSRAAVAAYRALALLGLTGTVAVYGITRLLKRGRRSGPQMVEIVDPTFHADEEIVAPVAGETESAYVGARGRVVRLYVDFLRRAAAWGLARRPDQTPREFELRWRGRPGSLSNLTRLFMDARYGPDEPGDADVRLAEQAAREAGSIFPSRRDLRP